MKFFTPIFATVLVTATLGVHAQEYEVEGVLTSKFDCNLGLFESVYNFRASVKDCQWSIQNVYLTRTKNGRDDPLTMEYAIAAADNENIYELSYYGSLPWTKAVQKDGKVLKAPNVGTAKIMTGTAPHDLIQNMFDLWLAFASHCYFRTANDPFIYPNQPLTISGLYFKDYRVKARWVIAAREPHLPQEVTYSDEMAWEASTNSWSTPGEIRATNITYKVLAYTNIGALQVPRSVAIMKYSTGTPEQRYSILRETVKIEVTNCAGKVSIDSFTPKLPGPVYLWDMRYEKATPPARVTTITTKWPSTNETQKLYYLATHRADLAPR